MVTVKKTLRRWIWRLMMLTKVFKILCISNKFYVSLYFHKKFLCTIAPRSNYLRKNSGNVLPRSTFLKIVIYMYMEFFSALINVNPRNNRILCLISMSSSKYLRVISCRCLMMIHIKVKVVEKTNKLFQHYISLGKP